MKVYGWNTPHYEIPHVDKNFIYWYPYAELETRFVLNHILSPNAKVIDVGANIGLITCSLAIRSPERQILAIEPSQEHRIRLEKNIDYLHLRNIEVINSPLSYKAMKKRAKIWVSHKNYRTSDVESFKTLDDVASEFANQKLELVKIDTDGYELRILLGSVKLLQSTDSIWLIEQTVQSRILIRFLIDLFMWMNGYKQVTSLDFENKMFAKKFRKDVLREQIREILRSEHKILFSDQNRRSLNFKPPLSSLSVDINAPKNFFLDESGFRFSKSDSHVNLFSFTLVLSDESELIRMRFNIIIGGFNVVVKKPCSTICFLREIYSHEREIEFKLEERDQEFAIVTFRSGLGGEALVQWTD